MRAQCVPDNITPLSYKEWYIIAQITKNLLMLKQFYYEFSIQWCVDLIFHEWCVSNRLTSRVHHWRWPYVSLLRVVGWAWVLSFLYIHTRLTVLNIVCCGLYASAYSRSVRYYTICRKWRFSPTAHYGQFIILASYDLTLSYLLY